MVVALVEFAAVEELSVTVVVPEPELAVLVEPFAEAAEEQLVVQAPDKVYLVGKAGCNKDQCKPNYDRYNCT